jgi:hypothetical protein
MFVGSMSLAAYLRSLGFAIVVVFVRIVMSRLSLPRDGV